MSAPSLHADALGVLGGWRPPAGRPDQEELRRRFVAHLASRPDGMLRSSYPAHVTAGAILLDATGDRVLLNLHRKAGRWFHFGGHAEADEELRDIVDEAARHALGLGGHLILGEARRLRRHSGLPSDDPVGGRPAEEALTRDGAPAPA